jgi:hypothetical protein
MLELPVAAAGGDEDPSVVVKQAQERPQLHPPTILPALMASTRECNANLQYQS